MKNLGFNNGGIESRDNSKEKVVLPIEGGSLEMQKSYFEYPRQIQEETHIKGYTRFKISREEFKEKFGGSEGKSAREVCRLLSDGKFPDKTYNHRIQADDGWEKEHQAEIVDDKFLLGKLTNVAGELFTIKGRMNKLISVLTDREGNVSFVGDVRQEGEDSYKMSELKGTKHDIKVTDSVRLEGVPFSENSKIVSREEYESLIKGKILVTTMSGLYTGYGHVFGSIVESPTFGFDVTEAPFKDYLNEVREVYSRIPEEFVIEKNASSLEHMRLEEVDKKEEFEVMLPVMTGDTRAPDLRWGHAKYAFLPTEKNLNFLVIDHLSREEGTN